MSRRTIQRLVKRASDWTSISSRVNTNRLRRTFAVTAIRRGISLASVQRLLGHEHLATTELYLNLSPEDGIREFEAKWYVVTRYALLPRAGWAARSGPDASEGRTGDAVGLESPESVGIVARRRECLWPPTGPPSPHLAIASRCA